MALSPACAWLLPAALAAPPAWAPLAGPWDGADGPVAGIADPEGAWIAWGARGRVHARPARGGEVVELPVDAPTREVWHATGNPHGIALVWGSRAHITLLGRRDGGWRGAVLPRPDGPVQDVAVVDATVVIAWTDPAGTPRLSTHALPPPFGGGGPAPLRNASPDTAARPAWTASSDLLAGRPTPGAGGVAWVLPDATGAVLGWAEGGAPEPLLHGSGALQAGRAFVVGRELWLPWADSDGWHVLRQTPPTR